MPSGFFKSQEGVDAYNAIQRPYDDTVDDLRYEKILKQTNNSPHSAKNKKAVRVMVRVVADDGNDYLKYDEHEVRYDAIGAPHETYKPNLGTYPIPISQPTLDYGTDGVAREVVNGPIVNIETGYSIPFTKENVDKIHAMANDISYSQRTQYILKVDGRKFTIKKYEDFRDLTVEELRNGGKVEQGQAEAIGPKTKR